MEENKKILALFDFDGTLVDSMPFWAGTHIKALTEGGIPCPENYAQTITPLVSGYLMDIKMTTLFPYAAIFVGLAFVTMALVKHGDSKAAAKVGLEALDVD